MTRATLRRFRTPDLREDARVSWRLFLDAKTEARAARLLARAAGRLRARTEDGRLERSYRDNFLAILETVLESRRWGDAVVETMALAQKVASGWTVLGDPRRELTGWASRPSIPGLAGAEWRLTRPATRPAARTASRPRASKSR